MIKLSMTVFNTVNAKMNNYNISPKKKFSILNKLLRKNKSISVPPLIENDKIINDSFSTLTMQQ